ncbi:hypothetical protein BKA70DRAFT_1223156 [Coprinopsis sp. MPI-PUGE-AT-0042]|nr:hypothetical protein BKA70DRAFT_1223156 [Coprinopsis sp. MPI-PUGE-AT-0042]
MTPGGTPLPTQPCANSVLDRNISLTFDELFHEPTEANLIEVAQLWLQSTFVVTEGGNFRERNSETGSIIPVASRQVLGPSEVLICYHSILNQFKSHAERFKSASLGRTTISAMICAADDDPDEDLVEMVTSYRTFMGVPTRVPAERNPNGLITSFKYVLGVFSPDPRLALWNAVTMAKALQARKSRETLESLSLKVARAKGVLRGEEESLAALEEKLASEKDDNERNGLKSKMQTIKSTLGLRRFNIGRLKKKLEDLGGSFDSIPAAAILEDQALLGKRPSEVTNQEESSKRARQDPADETNTGDVGALKLLDDNAQVDSLEPVLEQPGKQRRSEELETQGTISTVNIILKLTALLLRPEASKDNAPEANMFDEANINPPQKIATCEDKDGLDVSSDLIDGRAAADGANAGQVSKARPETAAASSIEDDPPAFTDIKGDGSGVEPGQVPKAGTEPSAADGNSKSKAEPEDPEPEEDTPEEEEEISEQKRLPERWEKLSKAQRKKFIKKGNEAFEAFQRSCICPDIDVRTWVRQAQEFFPEAGTYCRLLAVYCLILKGNITRCPHHTTVEHGSKVNDVAIRNGSLVKKRLPYKVTGVHWAPSDDAVVPPLSVEASKAMSTLQQGIDNSRNGSPDSDSGSESDGDQELDSWAVLGISMASKLQEVYRLFRVEHGRHVLHCGCDLEEVLFGLFIFKKFQSLTSWSDPLKDEELYGRAYLFKIFSAFCGLAVDNLYTRDRKGRMQTTNEVLENILSTVKRAFESQASPQPTSITPRVRCKLSYQDNIDGDGGALGSDDDDIEDDGEEWDGIEH